MTRNSYLISKQAEQLKCGYTSERKILSYLVFLHIIFDDKTNILKEFQTV